jgi:hypothetical protein
MEYTNQLIAKAKHSRCRICLEYITEPEADNQEFQAAKTSRGGYNFVHTRCWMKEYKEAVHK